MKEKIILNKLNPLQKQKMITELQQENIPLLALAVQYRQKDLVDLLLDNRADPNKHGASGENVLILAILSGSVEIVESLIRNGADPNLPDKISGLTPAMFVKQNQITWAEELINNKLSETNPKPFITQYSSTRTDLRPTEATPNLVNPTRNKV